MLAIFERDRNIAAAILDCEITRRDHERSKGTANGIRIRECNVAIAKADLALAESRLAQIKGEE